MADLPDDLIDRLTQASAYGEMSKLRPFDRQVHRSRVARILTALGEWADGALLDPDGWRRYAFAEVEDVELCIAHDEPQLNTPQPVGECRRARGGCHPVRLYALTERETTP